MRFFIVLFSLLFSRFLVAAVAVHCGPEAGGALCSDGYCCSNYGWCGTTDAYCSPENCQSQCPDSPTPTPPTPTPPTPPPPTPSGDVSDILSESMFEDLLLHRNDIDCPGRGFYTYSAFVTAARSFPGFGTTGTTEARTREIAAFLAQTSHETTGGWPTAPDGPYAWGYCFLKETGNPGDYCLPDAQWPCAPGKSYYGRGPIQLSYNANYGQCGRDIGEDLLANPDLVATDTIISFKTAIWFWMYPQPPKPSCHDVILDLWTPSKADLDANRLPGFGLTTNIINGGRECGNGNNTNAQNRIGFYLHYCDILGISPGDNLDCGDQKHYGYSVLHNTM